MKLGKTWDIRNGEIKTEFKAENPRGKQSSRPGKEVIQARTRIQRAPKKWLRQVAKIDPKKTYYRMEVKSRKILRIW